MEFAFSCFFLLFTISILFLSSLCNGSDTISAGEFLLANQTLISKQGSFELGFFTPGNSSNYYVGIWYKDIPVQTVVWVLNINNPIQSSFHDSCLLQISSSGFNLIVNSEVIWRSPVSLYVTEAVILDSGNFVLRNSSGILWQSFENPMDTWLPGAEVGFKCPLDEEAKLVSSRNVNDPANRCNNVTCGPNAVCDIRSSPFCQCLNGFVPRVKGDWGASDFSSGCGRMRRLQCDEVKTEFMEVRSITFPAHAETLEIARAGVCKLVCRGNCSCIAYANSNGGECLLFTDDLIDLERVLDDSGVTLYVKVSQDEDRTMKGKRNIVIVALVVPIGSGILILGFGISYLVWRKLKHKAGKHKSRLMLSKAKGTDRGSSGESALKHGVKLEELPIFTFMMLSNATQNFDPANMLGQGGFGLVYKGKLANGVEIAVKRLARFSNQGVEEFMNEVEVISRLQHRNLVRLLGCCVESEEKLLVYEYMPYGSLDAYLFGSHKHDFLNWQARKLIIDGICRGLLYLHRDSRLKIIHRDLKASNILLDNAFTPKISDFGMARIFGGKDDQANTTRVVGTFGYMSPEYAHRGIFSEKSDIYSFGILLLEIVSGKKNSSFYDQQLFLTAYAWKLWNEGKIVKLKDPSIDDGGMEDDTVRYANVGLLCVQEIAADRPNTSTVLSMLSCEIAELPRPKQPAFLGMQSSQGTKSGNTVSSKCSTNDVTISIVEGR